MWERICARVYIYGGPGAGPLSLSWSRYQFGENSIHTNNYTRQLAWMSWRDETLPFIPKILIHGPEREPTSVGIGPTVATSGPKTYSHQAAVPIMDLTSQEYSKPSSLGSHRSPAVPLQWKELGLSCKQ